VSRYRVDRIDDSTCPFEQPRHVQTLQPPQDEQPRTGEDGDCGACVPREAIWQNDRWRLRSKEDTSIPGTVVLETRDHLDSFVDLTPSHLVDLGPLVAAVERSLLNLGDISRVHVSRWGDGTAHFHLYFYPRPRGRLQLRGTFLAIWELLLPPADDSVMREAELVIAAGMRTYETTNSPSR
jgi:diadenosine tetraphosphate (Ap4A) HIT family hydrolase